MQSKVQFPDIRVLLIERNAQNDSLYRFALEDMAFYQITSATNTEEALDRIYFTTPGLIILGDDLYPQSAAEFVFDIRAGKTGAPRNVPIVMIGTFKAKTTIENLRDAGVTEMVSLPLSVESLRLRVLAALKKPRDFIDDTAYAGPDRRRREVEIVKCKRVPKPAKKAADNNSNKSTFDI